MKKSCTSLEAQLFFSFLKQQHTVWKKSGAGVYFDSRFLLENIAFATLFRHWFSPI